MEVRLYKALTEPDVGKEFIAQLNAYNPESGQMELELEDGTVFELNKKDTAAIRLAVIF